MDKQDNNTLKTVVLAVLVTLVIGIIGISFAYFTVNFNIGDTYGVGGKTKNDGPQIEFSENVSGITLDGTYPMPDNVGIVKSDEYAFTVTGQGNTRNIKVNVYLQVSGNNTLEDSLVNILYEGSVKTLSTLPQVEAVDYGFNKAYNLGYFVIGPNGTGSRTLKMWVNENGTVDNALGKNWSSKIHVVPEFTDEAISETSGTLNEILTIADSGEPLAWKDPDHIVLTPKYTLIITNTSSNDITIDIEGVLEDVSDCFTYESQNITNRVTIEAGVEEPVLIEFPDITLKEECSNMVGTQEYSIPCNVTLREVSNPTNTYTQSFTKSISRTYVP